MKTVQIIMPVHNREVLVQQTISSLYGNTRYPFKLTIIDEASNLATRQTLENMQAQHGFKLAEMPEAKAPGAARNAGVAISDPSDYLYFTDSDMYFMVGWLEIIVKIMEANQTIGIMGADNHPHHTPKSFEIIEGERVGFSSNQVGYSMLMRSQLFRDVNGFSHFPLGEYGLEDTEICERVKRPGLRLGHLTNRRVIHCGLHRSDGKQALGYESFIAQEVPEGVYRE